MNEEFYIGLNLFSVFLASCTQVILKKSAMNERLSGLSYFVNPATVTAYSIFLGCCLLTFYCLSHLPMITVNVLECSAYVYILFFDRIFFGKPITMRKVGGNLMIRLLTFILSVSSMRARAGRTARKVREFAYVETGLEMGIAFSAAPSRMVQPAVAGFGLEHCGRGVPIQ